MIPRFEDSGALPPGIHQASLAELEARFGSASELRRVQMESVKWMLDLARRAGVQRAVLNGSFVTDIIEPNDVDCVLLFQSGTIRDPAALKELRAGLPFLDIAIVRRKRFEQYVTRLFAFDRFEVPKGMVEVLL